MSAKGRNLTLTSYDDLFQTEEERRESSQERIQALPLDQFYPFPQHPFKVLDDEKMEETVQSVAQYGVLVPILARPRPEGGYEIVSGHRRVHASQRAGLNEIPATGRTGCIGHLVTDVTDSAFTWKSHYEQLETPEFQAERDQMLSSLRQNDLLQSKRYLTEFCQRNPDAQFHKDSPYYGLRINTAQYAYLLRLNPTAEENRVVCYCYFRSWLDTHLQNAERGIRFISPSYEERFRLADGDKIRITYRDGDQRERTCRYIDDYHLEVGDNLYHICEFAERVEQAGGQVIPLRSSLPETCFGALQTSREMILIKKGVMGYEHTYIYPEGTMDQQEAADALNDTMGVTKAQAAAMLAGSMFGWGAPAADPKHYDENGQPMKNRFRDRDAR